MKKYNTLLMMACFISLALTLPAQSNKSARPSPPAKASAEIGDLQIQIDYSQPSVKGRTIWGMLVPYGKVWRTGANEATTFQVNRDVMVEGKKLPAGKYALFSIPDKGKWTVIFNKNPDQWGAYNYESEKDALRVEIAPGQAESFTEYLTFTIKETTDQSGQVHLNWENIQLAFEVKPIE